jgi:DNA repair exonuclease SbcCD ATPase subunit
MKIRALRLWNVRRFGNRGVAIEDIGDGVNVLAAENELGKSTCFDALQALLFQPHSGTPKSIQTLRPYSGGSPRIEADIENADGLFRITKQYYAGKKALVTDLGNNRLVAQADEAEAWIIDLLHGGASGPTGLLWLRQGNTELESGGTAQQAQERKVREDALSSVAGEVEALTGGRRMARIIEQCQSELNILLTASGRPKKAGPYSLALEEFEQLQEEERAKKKLVDSLRSDLDERKRKTTRRSELTDPAAIEQRRLEKERTAEALEQAKRHAEQLTDALNHRQVETERHDVALEKLERFTNALERSAKLTSEINIKATLRGSALATRDLALTAEPEAAKALHAAENEVNAARRSLRQREAAEQAREAAAQLLELRATLEKAMTNRRAIERLVADGKIWSLPDGTIAELETLDAEIAQLRAALAAAAVTVTVEYAFGQDGAIRLDDKPVPGGSVQAVARTQRFEILGIGHLAVNAGAGYGKTESNVLLDKQELFCRRLDELGVHDLSALREHERQHMEIAADLRVARAELAALTPNGIDVLQARISKLENQVEVNDAEVPDINQVTHRLEKAERDLNQARTIRETARTRLMDSEQTVLRSEHSVDRLQDALKQSEEILGPPGSRTGELAKLTKAKSASATLLETAIERAKALQANTPDLATAEASANRANSVVESTASEIARLEQEISELTGLIKARSDDAVEEIHTEICDRRDTAKNRVGALETEIAVLSRLETALNNAKVDAREQYFGPVMEELKPLLALLFEQASITFDDGTLLPQSLERNGQDEDIAVLSGGMREQLGVLTRLAFARLLAKGGRTVPVILDDALVYSDDDRIERMFDALHRQARDLQIIVFTCRQRAFEKLGGQSLHITNWAAENKTGVSA